jgi:hypothetical protein
MAQLLVVRCRTKVACVPLMIAREGKGNRGEGIGVPGEDLARGQRPQRRRSRMETGRRWLSSRSEKEPRTVARCNARPAGWRGSGPRDLKGGAESRGMEVVASKV